MRIRRFRIFLGILVVLLIPTVASADGHRAGLGGGPSYGNGSSFWGFHVTGDWSPGSPAQKYLSLVGDFSALFNKDGDITTFMAGPSASYALLHDTKRLILSSHALFGGAQGTTDIIKAGAVGFGVEFVPRPKDTREVAFRMRYDRVIRGADEHDLHRVSVGVIYRWMKH